MNFPITVLKGAFKDIRGTIEKIMYYAIYKHSLMYDFGDEAKNMKASADFTVSGCPTLKHQYGTAGKYTNQSRKTLHQ